MQGPSYLTTLSGFSLERSYNFSPAVRGLLQDILHHIYPVIDELLMPDISEGNGSNLEQTLYNVDKRPWRLFALEYLLRRIKPSIAFGEFISQVVVPHLEENISETFRLRYKPDILSEEEWLNSADGIRRSSYS
ncbi:hypothetical protein BDQ17DRAFT_1333595 [Cyathus striatus]|nr:hypothetical protein BDQ17DRAFT_1333595 [Cyathus striatus]